MEASLSQALSTRSSAELLRLHTITLSHFSEKIRFLLTAAGIPHLEVPLVPFFHVVPAILSGGRTTVPFLHVDGKRIQDSTRILLWLDAHRGPLALLPKEPTERRETLAVENRFDEVGDHVVRYAYSTTLDDRESVIRYWTLDATPRQAALIRRRFGVLRWIFRRKLGMSARNVERSRAVVERGLDFIDSRLTAGHRYLATEQLTLADITAAALLAPLACPDEHAVYGSARYRAGAAPLVASWPERPAFEWVRGIYREHRGAFPEADRIRQALALPGGP
jgi:glutathione S-transferase